MSEPEQEQTQEPQTQPPAEDGAQTEPEQTTDEAPVEPGPERGHTSNVTDLPDGETVDPLTDTPPEPVRESELHGE